MILTPQITNTLIGAFIALGASIIVLVFTNKAQNKRQGKQHKHELAVAKARFLREKVEDIFLSFSRRDTSFASVYISLFGYVKGEMAEKDAYDMFNKQPCGSGYKERVEMLVSLYFPHLLPEYKTVMDERGKVVKYFPPRKSLIGDFKGYCSAQESFEEKIREFKVALKQEIDKLSTAL